MAPLAPTVTLPGRSFASYARLNCGACAPLEPTTPRRACGGTYPAGLAGPLAGAAGEAAAPPLEGEPAVAAVAMRSGDCGRSWWVPGGGGSHAASNSVANGFTCTCGEQRAERAGLKSVQPAVTSARDAGIYVNRQAAVRDGVGRAHVVTSIRMLTCYMLHVNAECIKELS